MSGQMQTFCGVMTGAQMVPAGTISTLSRCPETQNVECWRASYRLIMVLLSEVGAGVRSGVSFDIREGHYTEAILPTVFLTSGIGVVGVYQSFFMSSGLFRASFGPHRDRAPVCVIDDPLLKPAVRVYRLSSALDLMKRHRFAVDVAFIPWNCQRSARQTARLFKESRLLFAIDSRLRSRD